MFDETQTEMTLILLAPDLNLVTKNIGGIKTVNSDRRIVKIFLLVFFSRLLHFQTYGRFNTVIRTSRVGGLLLRKKMLLITEDTILFRRHYYRKLTVARQQ